VDLPRHTDRSWPVTLDFSELDTEIADLANVYGLAAEWGFSEVIGDMVREILEVIIPDLVRLLLVVPEDSRSEVAKRYRRLRDLLDEAEAAMNFGQRREGQPKS
jgi:hypothetical protein